MSPAKLTSATCVLLMVMLLAGCATAPARSEILERAYRSNNLGVALLEQFKYPEAAVAFREALAIDGSLAIARINLGLALFYARDLQGAVREAQDAAKRLPSAPQPHYLLGLVAYAENRTPDALREFGAVKQLDPADVGTCVNLGQIYLAERQYADAIAVLEPAVAAEPYNVTAAYNLGLALARSGQADNGRLMLARAQMLRTTGYAVTYGTGYLEQGRYAEALASTGVEPDLVDAKLPATSFSPRAIGSENATAALPASPFGRSFTPADLAPDRSRDLAAGLGGCVALVDVDGDGHLDLFVASMAGQRLFRNDGRAQWTDVTGSSGLDAAAPGGVPIGCVAGDYDNDGRADLFVLRYGGSTLYHNDGSGRFSDATRSAGVPPYPFLPGAAAFVDVDHDGDLDLVIAGLADIEATRRRAPGGPLVFPRDFAPAPLRLLRNNGNGAFEDVTTAARLTATSHAIAIVPTDFDNRRDIDLLIVNRDGPPMLFQNLRDGSFRDAAADVGLATAVGSAGEITAAGAADVNKDGFQDFFFARADGGVFAISDGRGRFVAAAAPAGAAGAVAAQFVDYDNDGLIDLLTWSAEGPHLSRHVGERWVDVSQTAWPRNLGAGSAAVSPRGLALADLNADGNTDLVTGGSGSPVLWRNSGTPGRRSQRAAIKGRVSNRLGIGSRVQIRAGSLSSSIETSAATPAVAPADIVFGLGARPGIDVIRVLWPSGILQAETPGPPPQPATLAIEELDRKPSSCPFLFTWNGERFEFVTDFMGAGELGYWEGPRQFNKPDPLEYVRIRGDQLHPMEGRFALRVTNELEETLFADRFRLLAIAHPAGVDVYPNEGMTDPAKSFRMFAVTGGRPPRAIDDRGRDVTDRIAALDRGYPDEFPLERFRGYAAPHSLTLDLAPLPDAPVLLLTGWTDYAFSSDNLAAHQAGLSLSSPSLLVKDASGHWRTLVADIGIPVGRPQTIPIDLAGRLRRGEHEVRIVTNMRIYWDQVQVGTQVPAAVLKTVTLDPVTATLRERGFSAEVRPDGREPARYDYRRVSPSSPWKSIVGRYTQEGDVRDLLTASDDMFVVAKPGDEIALDFDAAAVKPLPAGWTRTFLLLADGFSKEMDINSASPERVEPLPFHAMSGYPFRSQEHYPDGPAYERYQVGRNTRRVGRSVPSIDGLRTR